MAAMKTFPENFLWGAATSAYQVEGSPLADGAGANIWHRFAHTPGCIPSGDTGDIACDHYRRWESDVELMSALGLNAYRFSIAWARVLPDGRGHVNAKGLDFYRCLVDRLLEKGITPNATLYHWDLPVALDELGGWTNPDIANWFADYAQVMFDALGDRVPMWATINEPWVIVDGGYLFGVHAPGHASTRGAALAAKHVLLAHSAAMERYRAETRPGTIGIVLNLEMKDPASDSPEDVAAAKRSHTYFNEQYAHPLFLGRTPAGLAEVYGDGWLDWSAAELAAVSRPMDWLGINYYTRSLTAHDPTRPHVFERRVVPEGATTMSIGWEFYPPGLERTLLWVKALAGDLPLYVTETGGPFTDPAPVNGRVHDPLRVAVHRANLESALSAIDKGVDLRGYFAWALMDNLEWSAGFAQRFGLYHVDFATQVRTLKDSGAFYRDVIASNGAVLSK
jgi:beta-glucosidase